MIDVIYRYDPATILPPREPASPGEARERLCAGNREFVELAAHPGDGTLVTRVVPFDLADLGVGDSGMAPHQEPFAAVLGCSDARVPTELLFSEACNALFVVRVAGNVLGNECLGSLQYAAQHLGDHLKLIVVLGHSNCGAVSAAVDAFVDPARYLTVATSSSLRAVIDRLQVAVRSAAQALEQVRGRNVTNMKGYRAALIETAVALNAALTARTLVHEFKGSDPNRFQVVYGVYHLATREVGVPGAGTAGRDSELFDPPVSEQDYRDLTRRLASDETITQLLELA